MLCSRTPDASPLPLSSDHIRPNSGWISCSCWSPVSTQEGVMAVADWRWPCLQNHLPVFSNSPRSYLFVNAVVIGSYLSDAVVELTAPSDPWTQHKRPWWHRSAPGRQSVCLIAVWAVIRLVCLLLSCVPFDSAWLPCCACFLPPFDTFVAPPDHDAHARVFAVACPHLA